VETLRNLWKTGSRSTRIVMGIIGVVMACCCGVVGIGAADSSMRAAGILPTLTLTPTATLIPTQTSAPTATSTLIPTTVPPATPTSVPIPTDTAVATIAPLPTETPQPAHDGPFVVITRVNKRDEYVSLTNEGNQAQDLSGWVLLSTKGDQSCSLQGEIAPGQTLRVWAMEEDAGEEGLCCHFDGPIWNNDDIDLAILFNAEEQEVDRK